MQIQCCVPVLINLAMVQSLWAPLLLEEVHTTAVTLGIDYLGIQVEDVDFLEIGVEHNQHVSVSTDIKKKYQLLCRLMDFI